ncbi:MAG: zinc-ribbon domain containing protein [Acidobacteria bacterium]|nr:zinc-ribbon domain containing protein [Acidobacteriota bacterium]
MTASTTPDIPILCARCGASADTIVCRSCGQSFELKLSTRSWFAERGWSAPTRCAACRRKRRKGPTGNPA